MILKSSTAAEPDQLSVLGGIPEAVKIVRGDQPPLTLTYAIKSETCSSDSEAASTSSSETCAEHPNSPETFSADLNITLSAGDSIEDLVDQYNAELRTKFSLNEKNKRFTFNEQGQKTFSAFNTMIEAVRIDIDHIGFRATANGVTRIDLMVEPEGIQFGTFPNFY